MVDEAKFARIPYSHAMAPELWSRVSPPSPGLALWREYPGAPEMLGWWDGDWFRQDGELVMISAGHGEYPYLWAVPRDKPHPFATARHLGGQWWTGPLPMASSVDWSSAFELEAETAIQLGSAESSLNS